MPAKDLGNKFVCFKCATKFYDMKKPDPICPKCGTDQRESPALKPAPEGGKRSRLAAVPKVVEPVDLGDEPEPAAEEEAEGVEEEDADADALGGAEEDEP